MAGDREPLWAGSLADQPRRDDVIVRILEEPEDVPPPREGPPRRPRLGLALLAGGLLAALAIALDRPGALTIDDVPSHWGDIPMTCRTVRLERDERAAEWFWCRALGGRSLPPGLYESPDSQWTSDLTRRPAGECRIRIAPDGEVAGWATYPG